MMNQSWIRPKKSLQRLNGRDGFSLMETMVTVLIFTIIMGAIQSIFLIGDSSWNVNNIHIELQQELRKAMDWMKDDLRQTGATAIANVPANGTWYSTITFQKAIGVSGSGIIWNSDTTQFILGGTNADQLQRIEGGSTDIIAQSLESLQFRRLATAPKVIEVALQAQRDNYKGRPINLSLNFKIQLRE